MQSVPEEWREAGRTDGGKHSAGCAKRGEADHLSLRNGTAVSDGGMEGAEAKGEKGDNAGEETLMMELSRLVQRTVKESSWWERRGVDCSILAGALLCLPPGEAPLAPLVAEFFYYYYFYYCVCQLRLSSYYCALMLVGPT